jgi:hypothetical protein
MNVLYRRKEGDSRRRRRRRKRGRGKEWNSKFEKKFSGNANQWTQQGGILKALEFPEQSGSARLGNRHVTAEGKLKETRDLPSIDPYKTKDANRGRQMCVL